MKLADGLGRVAAIQSLGELLEIQAPLEMMALQNRGHVSRSLSEARMFASPLREPRSVVALWLDVSLLIAAPSLRSGWLRSIA